MSIWRLARPSRRPLRIPGIKRPRVKRRQLLGESIAGLLQRPGRSALTTLGTVLGIGAFIAVLGITSTANSQISGRFNSLAITQVTVEQAAEDNGSASLMFPTDSEQRVGVIGGVQHSGLYWKVGSNPRVGQQPPGAGSPPVPGAINVTAVTPGFWDASHPVIKQGRTFGPALADSPVAVVGASIAKQLNLVDVAARPAVFIDGVAVTVIGIISDTRRMPDSLLSVTIPAEFAKRYWGPPLTPARMLIETDLGAASVVAAQAPVALRPDQPEAMKVAPLVEPKKLQQSVTADLGVLFLALALICLVIGAVGIANTTLVAVLERVPEIGLRRALGARPRHIGTQFLIESTFLGGFGGLIGTSLGVLSIVALSVAKHWTATVEPWLVVSGPALGAVVGLLAGAYPSLRAARIEPVEALNR
ncbi:putative ABC transport system permease protein [Nocardioides sp. BE266]|uniref:ABC transporter permease n=1 Tax=Nocardioides sp. BE266 TaxID=2817725 RepID=UPI002855FE21|nr:ABC transporter permease [Nocardioides sp. BE266]MDR7255075.1 putative ABC transport system permease protein [Nocardioides sp. BE266]